MPAVSSSAPGKIILFGEHAAVYNRPAIAMPVHQLTARAYFLARPDWPTAQVLIQAPDVGLLARLSELPEEHPFVLIFSLMAQQFDLREFPAMVVKIKSDIPIAAGLGSGTAVTVALIRGLAHFVGKNIGDEEVCALTYEVEKIYHGTPSGIDNTVVTYARPVFFIKGDEPEILNISKPLTFIIADSGTQSKTSEAVSMVKMSWEKDKTRYETIFDQIGNVAAEAKEQLVSGAGHEVGVLMLKNHTLLDDLGVSNAFLNGLVDAAMAAGASGAKLSGAGRGGNVIALASAENASKVRNALLDAGAVKLYTAELPATVEDLS